MGQQPNIELDHTDSPRRRLAPGPARSWKPDRPADFSSPASIPAGGHFGVIGPDSGYALKLAAEIEVRLAPGEHHHDAVAAVGAIASARAAVLGRAPIAEDVAVGMTVLGYSDGPARPGLIAARPSWIANVGHDAGKLRAIVAAVPSDLLIAGPAEIASRIADGWEYRGLDVPE